MESTRKKITSRIRQFLKRAGLSGEPRYLPYVNVDSEYQARLCLDNCNEDVQKNGGEIVFGWVIWENKKSRLIEAEFHAVVKRKGQLMDVTPRVDGEFKVLFVPDSSRVASLQSEGWYTWSNLRSFGSNFEAAVPLVTPSRIAANA